MSLLFFLLAGPGSSAERGGKNGFCGCGSCVSRWRWGRARRARRRQHRLQLRSPGPGLGEGHGARRVRHRASSCTGRWKSTGLAGCGVLPGSPPPAASQGSEREVGVVAGGTRCRRSTRNRGVPACAPAGIPGVDQPRHTEQAPRDAVLPARGSPGDAVAPGGHVGAACLGGGVCRDSAPDLQASPQRKRQPRCILAAPHHAAGAVRPHGVSERCRGPGTSLRGGERGPWIVVGKGHGGGDDVSLSWSRLGS